MRRKTTAVHIAISTENGREIRRGNAFGEISFTYDAQGRLSSVTDAKNDTLTLTYENGRLRSVTADQITTSLEYYGDTLNAVQGPELSPWARSGTHFGWMTTFDGVQKISSISEPGKRALTIGYDWDGRVSSLDDVGGTQQRFASNAEALAVSSSSGETTEIQVNALGKITRVESSGGNLVTFAYDSAGRLLEERRAHDSGEDLTTYARDSFGRITSITTPDGVRTNSYSSSSPSAFPSQSTDTDSYGNQLTTTFDNKGRPLTASMMNRTQSWTYDASGELISETDFFGNITSITRDSRGAALSVTAGGQTQTYTYNNFGQPTSNTDAFGRGTTLSYDAKGNFLAQNSANGPSVGITREVLGSGERIVTTIDGESSTVELDQLRRPRLEVSRHGSTTTQYDPYNGRPTNVTRVHRGAPWQESYSYTNTGDVETRSTNGRVQQSSARVVPPGFADQPSL